MVAISRFLDGTPVHPLQNDGLLRTLVPCSLSRDAGRGGESVKFFDNSWFVAGSFFYSSVDRFESHRHSFGTRRETRRAGLQEAHPAFFIFSPYRYLIHPRR